MANVDTNRRARGYREDEGAGAPGDGGKLMSDDESPWYELLRELFGDRADEAIEEMRRMGMDPAAIAENSGVAASPGMMEHIVRQLRALMEQSDGEDVNWALAHDVARGVAAMGGDPTVTAAEATEYRAAVTAAELWLDAVTELAPATATPYVWSHAEWVEATLPTWRVLAGPVAVSVSQALGGLLSEEAGETAGVLVSRISPTVCGMHVGQAAGAMAREAFGATDLGFSLLPDPRVVMVPRAIREFADGLEIPAEEVRHFLALREAAHVRLFRYAPWLAARLSSAIERYARGVRIDPEALDRAVREAGSGDPRELQQALSKGIFVTGHTEEQEATLAGIEATLALVEGWVEDVTTAAALPHLPHLEQLREMARRRRAAGGPAEDTFATLLGLELRPRRMREAAAMWAALASRIGRDRRDEVWAHPDLLPDADQLAHWELWVAARSEDGDEVDRELREMLGDA